MKRLRLWLVGIIGLIGLSSFGYCQEYTLGNRSTLSSSSTINLSTSDLFCIQATSTNRTTKIQLNGTGDSITSSLGGLICVQGVNSVNFIHEGTNAAYYIMSGFDSGTGDCPLCPDCEICVECPVCNSGTIISGDNWSALYINEIQHESAPLINITIPEEFDWDYSGTEEEFDLDIKGFNVDTEYIDGIITTQRTLPNNTDFNNTISGLIPIFIPGLVIIIFLLFIFRFIKKIF